MGKSFQPNGQIDVGDKFEISYIEKITNITKKVANITILSQCLKSVTNITMSPTSFSPNLISYSV